MTPPRKALLLAFGAVLLVAGIAISAFRPNGFGDGDTEDPTPAQTCEDSIVRVPCFVVRVADQTVRYAFLEGSDPTAGTVLFDPGGPGTSVLSGEYDLGSIQQTVGDRYSLLVLEEPWVTRYEPQECADAVRMFYRAARHENDHPIDETATRVWDVCELDRGGTYGFSQGLYAAAVESILAQRRDRLVGFVGHSFASQRLSYLSMSTAVGSLRWAVIVRPFPGGVGLTELIAARSAAVERAVGRPSPPGAAVALPDRSVDVTDFDYWSALAGLGYVSEADWSNVAPTVVNGINSRLIGSLSDQLWMRYGVDDLSAGMLAQWQEVCPTQSDFEWQPVQGIPSSLAALFAPCSSSEFRGGFRLDLTRLKLCVTSSVDDLVTPDELIRRTFEGAEVVEAEERSHGSLEGLDDCLVRVGAR